jgi:hypothetical protein
MFMSHAMIDHAQLFPNMDGPAVFKKSSGKISRGHHGSTE